MMEWFYRCPWCSHEDIVQKSLAVSHLMSVMTCYGPLTQRHPPQAMVLILFKETK